MDNTDKKILENELAQPLGRAVSLWAKKNDIDSPVVINANLTHPSCYVDEQGVTHFGHLIVVNCEIIDNDDDYDDDFD